jgi:ClpP class serine protease
VPTWNDILADVTAAGSTHDVVRRKYLRKVASLTKRNVIVYYSGWLQKAEQFRQQQFDFTLNDADKNGLMAVVHEMDRAKGLDLILQTPGGDMAATESLIQYLRSMFGTNIRAFIPQIAMSGGTMIALAAREIVMGKHSNLGPIDPQLGGVAAHAIKEEIERAIKEVTATPQSAPIWQVIVSKYGPTLYGESAKVLTWADQMCREWLRTGMFDGDAAAGPTIDRIMMELGDHATTKSHARHISADQAAAMGLKVTRLEADQALQDAVLSVHHATVITLTMTPAIKVIENDRGIAHVTVAQTFMVMQQRPG